MADEEKKPEDITGDKSPQELTDAEVEEIAHSVPDPTEYPPGQEKELEERLPEDETVFEEAVVEAIEVSEELADSAPVEAFDTGVTAIQEGIEAIGGPPETPREAHAELHHGDVTVFMGKEYAIPIYTSVFIALGVLTVIEVLIAEIIRSDIKIPLLLGIALAKAFLVVLFYMHLKTDSRVFALTLAVPLGVGILSVLFLLAVPATGGY
jgi:caa(3)-type oxidase subunit IV